MEPERLLALLPWRQPFLMIDRLLECEPQRSIVTLKNVTANDPVAGGFPGVLLLEGMSQSAALLFRLSYEGEAAETLPMLGFLRASLSERSVLPGEAVTYRVRAVKMTRTGGVFQGRASVERRIVARAELAFKAADREGRAA
jgi:3-hydroxyacyl-[acyl-carrier-protein] dehydratase